MINIIENQVKKNINKVKYFGKNGFLRHILNQSFELQKNTENFFNEDLLRTKEFFDKTLGQLQSLREYVEVYRDKTLQEEPASYLEEILKVFQKKLLIF